MSEDSANIKSVTLIDVDGVETVVSRRHAKVIVNKHFRRAMVTLENRGQTRRALPGLLYAAMSILIETLEPSEVVSVISDRIRGIFGSSDNADAPPITISNDKISSYVELVIAAGQTIIETVAEALEELDEKDIGDLFPETVLDVALGVLLAAWGSDHVKRALYEQTALIIRGINEPVNFMEPAKLLEPSSKKQVPIVEHAPTAIDPASDHQKPRKLDAYQRVSGYILSDMSLSGVNAWVVSILMMSTNREEERLISGVVEDHSGRAGWVHALRECVLVILQAEGSVEGRIDLSSEEMLRAVQGAPGSRLGHEAEAWADVDSACALYNLEFRYIEPSLSLPEVEKCDFRIRELLQNS